MVTDSTISFTEGTAPPRLALPPGAVDCHHHVYEEGFPVAPGARPHAPATLAEYARLRTRLGFSRNVLVQPSTYGFDNRLHLRAAEELGEVARLVVVVPPDVPAAELSRMHAAGARGARANLVQGIPLSGADVAPLGRRMAEQGWHLQIFACAELIAELGPVLRALPCPVVFDHFCQLPLKRWQDHPAWAVVMDLLQAGRTWVKLSSPYSLDQENPAVVGPLARALVAAAPERMLWGTNWPHPNAERIPDDAALLDLLADWAPAEATRRAILVDNPVALYDFRT